MVFVRVGCISHKDHHDNRPDCKDANRLNDPDTFLCMSHKVLKENDKEVGNTTNNYNYNNLLHVCHTKAFVHTSSHKRLVSPDHNNKHRLLHVLLHIVV